MTILGEETNEFKKLIENIKEKILQQKNILAEIKGLYGIKHLENENLISAQIKELMTELNKLNERIPKIINDIAVQKTISRTPEFLNTLKKEEENFKLDELEKETLKRLKKETGIIKKEFKKTIKEDLYAKFANKFFFRIFQKIN